MLNASLVHVREVFETTMRRKASGIMLFHNHSSEDTDPSQNDLEITRRIVEAEKILEIK